MTGAQPIDLDARLITTDRAATRLSVSPRSLRAWRAQGAGPPYVRIGVTIRYRISDLDAWIAQQRVHPQPTPPTAA